MKILKYQGLQVIMFAVFAFLILGGYTIIRDQHTNIDALFNEVDHFDYPMFAQASDDTSREVFQLCRKKKFTQAYKLIESFHPQAEIDPRLLFAKGICLLQLDRYSQAEAIFQELLAENYPLIQDHTMWYLALINLKTSRLDEAQNYLYILAGQPNADYHMQACDLLKELGFSPQIVLM